MLSIALDYAKRGWFVFPVDGKIPFAHTHGHKEASTDESTIRSLWAKHPNGNIGIATGLDSCFLVLDIDVQNKVGEKSISSLESEYGALPVTVQSRTASGGRHLFFRYPGALIKNSQGKIGENLDIRAEGGYIVAPGSVLANGDYEWINHPDDYEMASTPTWLVNKCLEQNREAFELPQGTIPQGQQDDLMFKFACSLKSQGFPPEMVRVALHQSLEKCDQDQSNPFTDRDIDRWIKSAFSYADKNADGKKESVAETKKSEVSTALVSDSSSSGNSKTKVNELNRAHILIEKYTLIYTPDGSFYQYDDGYYQLLTETQLVRIIIIEFGCLKNNVINLIIRIIKSLAEVALDQLNTDQYLNLANGLYNLKAYCLNDHTHKVLSTIRLAVSFDESALCPRWEAALSEVIQDQENINALQEFFGLCMTKETYDKALFLTGEGSNGKSTLLDVLKGILGNENTCEVQLEQLDKTHYVAQLHNKLLNIASEIGAKGTVCDEMFKKIVAHDYIMGDHKFGHPFSFRPVCKLIFATNNMPRTDDKSMAFFRRLLLIHLNKQFNDFDAKHKYYKELLQESAGIFNWMVVGLKRLRKRGHFAMGKEMIGLIENYKIENNPIRGFVDDVCAIDGQAEIEKSKLYQTYKDYCLESGFKPVNIRKFGKELKRCGFDIKEGWDDNRTTRVWSGIKVRSFFESDTSVRPF